MNRTLLQVKVLYDKMGRAEKKIADWILSHPGDLIPLSICELAEECNCSEATNRAFCAPARVQRLSGA